MISRRLIRSAAALILVSVWQTGAVAQPPSAGVKTGPPPFVSPIFGDNMVMQRGKPNTIWGWSEPGQTIRLEIGDKNASAIVGPDRRWQAKIDPPPVGGPYTLKITGPQTAELHNVMVGDVWLCSGQSNMQFALRQALNGPDEVKAADYPEIRFFTVGQRAAYRHVDVPQGTWRVVSPQTADRVSAVAYYFARKLHQELHVPIGLVIDAVGGTPAEAWTSAGALREVGDFDVPLSELQKVTASGAPEYGNYVNHWYDEYDVGLKGNWASPDSETSDWKEVTLPGGFKELGVPDAPALVYFRKQIILPDPLPSGRATLFLGSIEKMDTAYINGKQVGGSAWVENPRVYPIFPGVLRPGKNEITLRIFKTRPDGGFLSKPEDLRLVLGNQTTIPLAGMWVGKVSVDARAPHPLPIGYQNWPVMPSVLYEGMIAPLEPLAITGVIWYQGEENQDRGVEYRKVLPAMIADWRKAFGQGDFPFLIAQLPAYQPRSATPTDDGWADVRESQALTVAKVSNSCLAVTIDTGEADNIHPKEKIPVGDRLARCALATAYKKNVVYEGPTLASVERLSNEIKLHFTHADGGLIAKGGKLEEFAIDGADGKFVWADARIDGDSIVVSSTAVPHPKDVRYAWQSNPAANLVNGAGLPAAPFRTDSLPLITEGKKY